MRLMLSVNIMGTDKVFIIRHRSFPWVSQMKTLQFFYQLIWCRWVWYSFVIFQHSPCCAPCMSSSASLMPGFLVKKYPLAACAASDALPLALLHWITMIFHKEPPWVAQSWGRHSEWMFLIISAVTWEGCGLAMSCSNKTQVVSSSPSSFHTGTSGPSSHLQPLCTSGSHHLVFGILTQVPGRHPSVFPSVHESLV
jgi:hypothetical protein